MCKLVSIGKLLNFRVIIYLLLLSLSACGNNTNSSSQTNDISQLGDAAIADEAQTSDWLAYGRTHNERRFSPLKDIDLGNVADLKVDWYLDLPDDRGLVSTPLVVNGVLYFIGTMNIVKAVDATNGNILWEYDPEVAEILEGKKQVGWSHNRGITFYKGKIFLATWDGRLIALDAKNGTAIWTTRTIELDGTVFISGAPKAFKGKILIGNGGTEEGSTRGYITAYDAETGAQAWRFHIVPGNPADGFENDAMAMAAKTWTGEWWKYGGGGNVWNGYTYDADLDVLYVGTGNGAPWNRKIRSPEGGDNLFLCSILALDPDTGEYLWHYQTTPGESWDYNSTMDIVLADLDIDGTATKVILHAPKNGFFYVINRETGKLISAEPFVKTTWASHIDLKTGRPVEIPGARYETNKATISPDSPGAHSWPAMSYNPETQLVYIPTNHFAGDYSDANIDVDNWQKSTDSVWNTGVNVSPSDYIPQEYLGSLQAWDPIKNRLAWRIPQETPMNGGTMTTAGNLVFQGRTDGKFLAYDARTGDVAWTFDAGLGISAPPITYSVNGKQYISLLVGFGGGYAGMGSGEATDLGWQYGVHMRRLVTFSLAGKADLPPLPPPSFVTPKVKPNFKVDETLAKIGSRQWGLRCSYCHGYGVVASGYAPDLRASEMALDEETFRQVVQQGALLPMGMPAFPDLTDGQVRGLFHHIRKRANETVND